MSPRNVFHFSFTLTNMLNVFCPFLVVAFASAAIIGRERQHNVLNPLDAYFQNTTYRDWNRCFVLLANLVCGGSVIHPGCLDFN